MIIHARRCKQAGIPGDRLNRTLTMVFMRGNGLVDLRFGDGSETMIQVNSTFSIEAFEIPLGARA